MFAWYISTSAFSVFTKKLSYVIVPIGFGHIITFPFVNMLVLSVVVTRSSVYIRPQNMNKAAREYVWRPAVPKTYLPIYYNW